MKTQSIKFAYRKKKYDQEVAFPETLVEAVALLGEAEAFEIFLTGYREHVKKQILGIKPKRKRIRKINLDQLSPDQVQVLKEMGLLNS